MTAWQSAGELKDLVTAVVSAGDPVLFDRACRALGLLLAEHNDAAKHSHLFEWC